MNDQEDPKTSAVVTSRPRTSAPDDRAAWLMVAGTAGQIGYMIAIPAVIFVMCGAWVDSYFRTKPLFTLLGIPLALIVSAMSVWRLIKQLQQKDKV
ncbi:AtpZ/AtpI family protein [Candidatus Peribacteria bacterium]|nr:AtpZ/AtpI family protein [Candidatus Peribacteria bacterium]